MRARCDAPARSAALAAPPPPPPFTLHENGKSTNAGCRAVGAPRMLPRRDTGRPGCARPRVKGGPGARGDGGRVCRVHRLSSPQAHASWCHAVTARGALMAAPVRLCCQVWSARQGTSGWHPRASIARRPALVPTAGGAARRVVARSVRLPFALPPRAGDTLLAAARPHCEVVPRAPRHLAASTRTSARQARSEPAPARATRPPNSRHVRQQAPNVEADVDLQ